MTETFATIRLAAVGTGFFSQFHYEAWRRLGVQIVGLCSLDMDAVEKVSREVGGPPVFADIGAMLDAVAPDLIDIITPPPTHGAMLDQAIARGIPAICQKPFTRSLTEARSLVARADAGNATVIVHENFRFQPWYGEIKRLLDGGDLGDVYQASFRLRPGDGQGGGAYLDRQPYFQKMERFLVHETAIHLIDVFRYLLGEVDAVTARLAQLNPAIAGEDAGLIIFEFENGRRSLFDGNRLADHAADNRRLVMGEMWIDGSDATVTLDGDGRLFLRRHGKSDAREIQYDWENRGYGGDCVYHLQRHVIEHLITGTPLMNRAQDYLTNLEVEESVYRSHVEERRVRVSEIQETCS